MTTFERDLRELVNKHYMEKGSDTADFILATYLAACLQAFDEAVNARENCYGRGATPPAVATAAESQRV